MKKNIIKITSMNHKEGMSTCSLMILVVMLIGLSPFVSSQSGLQAQGDLACINHINMSLDPITCTGFVTPQMCLVGNQTCADGYELTIKDEHGNVVPNAFTIDDVNQTFTYEVCCEDNCCWGTVLVEYKAATFNCPADDTIHCATLDFYSFAPPTSSCSNLTVTILHDEKTHLDCDPELTASVHRTYKILDDFGNETKCHQNIGLKRLLAVDIVWPGDTQIMCSDSMLVFNDEGAPYPWYYQPMTGSGTGMGIGIPLVCGVSAPFDFFFPSDTNVEPPTTTGSYGTTIVYGNNNTGTGGGTGSRTGFFCPGTGSGTGAFPLIPFGGATLLVETGDVDDPDLDVVFVNDSRSGEFCNAQLTYTDLVLPFNGDCHRKIARTWEFREWWCTDELSTSSLQIIQIEDDMAPKYVCPGDVTISTNRDCAGDIALPKLNPVDECSSESNVRVLYAGGVTEGDGQKLDLKLGANYIKYIVSDNCDNSSECNSVVTVRDGYDPVAICEAHKVVSLSTLNENKIAASVFDNGSFDDCGIDRMEARRMDGDACVPEDEEWSEYVRFCCDDVLAGEVMVMFRVLDKSENASVCMVAVEVQDKLTPNLTCPPDMTIDCADGYDRDNLGLTFGLPSFGSTCATNQIPEESVILDVDQCGIGSISRTFKFTDDNGFILKSCKQNLLVESSAPFVVSNIQWPLDFQHNSGCGTEILAPQFLPDGFGFPGIYGDNGCNLIGYDYEDETFKSSPGSNECVVIQRTWTVINWCSATGAAFDTWTSPEPQLITLTNNVAPTLDANMEVSFDAHNSDCKSGQIVVTRSAFDDCDGELNWFWVIKTQSGDIVETGTGQSLTGTFPTGVYNVEWTVDDGCGNSASDIQVLNIFDNTPPTPVCHNGLSASLIGWDSDGDGVIDSEKVELWASDFDAGSYPNCENPITFSFTSDTDDNLITYDCSHLGRQEINLWVTDVNTGAQDFCTAFIDIQDSGLCPGNNLVVEGEVYTETSKSIEGVEMILETGAGIEFTANDGSYAFVNMPMGGSYELKPQHDVDYHNGVSTIDIIMIQRHILNIELLDSPYKLIAADVDGNGEINGIDLIELRKLVLGIYTELPQNDSWRFVSAEHAFSDPLNPWSSYIPEDYDIQLLSSDMDIDFIGVKIGDVNDDAAVNVNDGESGTNYGSEINLSIDNKLLEEESVSSIPVRLNSEINLVGLQGTLEYDQDAIELVALESGEVSTVDMNNVNLTNSADGYVSFSIDDIATDHEEGAILFHLVVKAKKNITTGDLFNLSSKLTQAEAYNGSQESLAINLGKAHARSAEILNVSPNPFRMESTMQFFLPESEQVTFSYFDVNGRLLKKETGTYSRGLNSIDLNREDFNTSGFVYIKMLAGDMITEYRMMIL